MRRSSSRYLLIIHEKLNLYVRARVTTIAVRLYTHGQGNLILKSFGKIIHIKVLARVIQHAFYKESIMHVIAIIKGMNFAIHSIKFRANISQFVAQTMQCTIGVTLCRMQNDVGDEV